MTFKTARHIPQYLNKSMLTSVLHDQYLTSIVNSNGFLLQSSGFAGTTSRWQPRNVIVPFSSTQPGGWYPIMRLALSFFSSYAMNSYVNVPPFSTE